MGLERLSLDLDAWGTARETKIRDLCTRAGMDNPRIETKILFAIIDGANQHRALSADAYPVEDVIAGTMTRFRREGTS